MPYIYLASPYSHPQPMVRFGRFSLAALCCANLYRRGVTVFSPIVHCHTIASRHDFPTDAEFWRVHNEHMQDGAKSMWVLKIDGWDTSEGIQHEVERAQLLNQGLAFVDTLGKTTPYDPPPSW